MQTRGYLLGLWREQVANFGQRANALEYRVASFRRVIDVPKCFENTLWKKCRSQVRLWVQINSNNSPAHLRQHPREVEHQRRLPNAALVVEEREYRNAQGVLRIVTFT